MLCTEILGKLQEVATNNQEVDYVEIPWFDAFKKIHKLTSEQGREVGLRMPDKVLTSGLFQDDVVYADDKLVIAVKTPPTEVISIKVDHHHAFMVAKACWEIGNRHAPLFYGENSLCFYTIYNEPMYQMLSKLHGVEVKCETRTIDFNKRVSATVHNHQH